MTRIEITPAAYAALARGKDPDSLLPPLRSPLGGFFIWLDLNTLNRLTAARGPAESYSAAILRLAGQTA